MATIRMHSARFGEIEIPEDRVLNLPEGLMGFEDHKRFALITGGDSPFMWLQSLSDPALAFVVTDPLVFMTDYRPDIDEDTVMSLEAEDASQLRYLAIAVVPPDPSRTTLNLRAPIAVNQSKRLARQVVTLNPDYPLRYFVFRLNNESRADRGGARRAGRRGRASTY